MTHPSSYPLRRLVLSLSLLLSCSLLGACDLQSLLKNSKVEAREAEGRAIGSACRHSGRALEDCYALNPKVVKAAIFTGWRDMDAYMRENNISAVPSTLTGQAAEPTAAPEEAENGDNAATGDAAPSEEAAPAADKP